MVGRAFQRCIPVLNLTLVALAAYFQAFGVTRLIAAALAPGDEKPAATAESPSARASTLAGPSDHATTARSILDRNPFDSVTPRPLDAASMTLDGDFAQVDLSHVDRAPLCDGYKALVVLASPNPAWSMAAVRRNDDPDVKVVRTGEVFGPKVVRLVEWNRVVLSSGASLCQIVMFRARKPAASAQTLAGGDIPLDIKRRIRKLGPTEFDVDRQAVADIVANQAELLKSVRIVPERENGVVVGVRLLGVRPESLLGALGFESGDRLDSIDGVAMTSPESGLEALIRLRRAEHLGVRLNRRGKEATVDFNIR